MKYDQDLTSEITRAQRYTLPLSGIMLDIDNFKEINDKYGHLAGDGVLIKLTANINSIIRGNDQLYRWGGEEFIMLLPNTTLKEASKLASRIYNYHRGVDFTPVSKVTCSFGVTYLKENDTADTFTKRLDQLLYQAKKNGKDTIVSDKADKNLSLF